MNCPHCHNVLPEKYGATYCPFCGIGLPSDQLAEATGVFPLSPVKIRWWLFFGALLAPPLLTFLTAFILREQTSEDTAPLVAVLGAAAGGITCGVMLGLRFGNSVPLRVGLGFLFSCLMVVVCFTLSFCGCMVGGYKFKL